MADEEFEGALFEEPEGFYKEKRPNYTQEVEIAGETYKVTIVGEHPLWGNYIWNASKCVAQLFQESPELVKNKTVLELGAGVGIPSLSAAKQQAELVLITDYPEESLIENLRVNVRANLTEEQQKHVQVKGFLWGKTVDEVVNVTEEMKQKKHYDVIILSDLICNHGMHRALLDICRDCSTPETLILVAFSHHRPWKAKDDMDFFSIAEREYPFTVTKLKEQKYSVMFEQDAWMGEKEMRETVHVFKLSKIAQQQQQQAPATTQS